MYVPEPLHEGPGVPSCLLLPGQGLSWAGCGKSDPCLTHQSTNPQLSCHPAVISSWYSAATQLLAEFPRTSVLLCLSCGECQRWGRQCIMPDSTIRVSLSWLNFSFFSRLQFLVVNKLVTAAPNKHETYKNKKNGSWTRTKYDWIPDQNSALNSHLWSLTSQGSPESDQWVIWLGHLTLSYMSAVVQILLSLCLVNTFRSWIHCHYIYLY